MLIEFCCPVCQAPLAINKKAVGGQVNCPKCQKLILLPAESPLSRLSEDVPPFTHGQQRDIEDVVNAIHISVDPYRHDLENKSELLNDAVEMIKIRNERIKEIESLILQTQKELWEAEVLVDEQKETYKKTRSQLKEVRQELRGTRDEDSEKGGELRRLNQENEELRSQLESIEDREGKLKLRLTNMVEHAEELEKQLLHHQGAMHGEAGIGIQIDAMHQLLSKRLEQMPGELADIELAMDLLRKSNEELDRLHKALEETERQRQDLEELVRSSTVDMQNALDDRKQWRNQALELEKKITEANEGQHSRESELQQDITELQATLQSKQIEIQEEQKIREEKEEDIRLLQAKCSEMEDSLALHRKRSQEKETAQEEALQQARHEGIAEASVETGRIQEEVNELKKELEEAEARLEQSLILQQQMAEQNLVGEKERKELKRKLRESLKAASS